MHFIIMLFAALGSLILSIVLVIASMAGVGLSLMFLAGCSADVFISREAGENGAGLGFFVGLIVGLVWSIWAISTVGFISAFLSVAALCVVMFALTGLVIWYAESRQSRAIVNGA